MGEEETELEAGVYGGENFINNVRNSNFIDNNLYNNKRNISGVTDPPSLLAPGHQPWQGPG